MRCGHFSMQPDAGEQKVIVQHQLLQMEVSRHLIQSQDHLFQHLAVVLEVIPMPGIRTGYSEVMDQI